MTAVSPATEKKLRDACSDSSQASARSQLAITLSDSRFTWWESARYSGVSSPAVNTQPEPSRYM